MARISKQWINCSRCDTRFKADTVVECPIDQYVAFMMAMKCPSCGAGADHLALGGGMDLATDMKFRSAVPASPFDLRYADWVEFGDVGQSVASLVFAVTGKVALEGRPDLRALPADPSDFRRILLAMDRMPELRRDLHKASSISPGWKVLVDRFAEVEAAFLEELGPGMSDGRAERTYALLQEIAAAKPESTDE